MDKESMECENESVGNENVIIQVKDRIFEKLRNVVRIHKHKLRS